MKTAVQKKVCLLMNLGGFDERASENLEMAARYGESVFSLTENGIADASETPVNVLAMQTEQLMSWSEMINNQIKARGFRIDSVVILAGGRNKSGLLPLGTIIKQNIRIGA